MKICPNCNSEKGLGFSSYVLAEHDPLLVPEELPYKVYVCSACSVCISDSEYEELEKQP